VLCSIIGIPNHAELWFANGVVGFINGFFSVLRCFALLGFFAAHHLGKSGTNKRGMMVGAREAGGQITHPCEKFGPNACKFMLISYLGMIPLLARTLYFTHRFRYVLVDSVADHSSRALAWSRARDSTTDKGPATLGETCRQGAEYTHVVSWMKLDSLVYL